MDGSKIFAAVGDVHGQQHRMVELLTDWERRAGRSIAFVLQVGDFEPHRKKSDLAGMSAPARKRQSGDFRDFVSGRHRFPWPLFFIGGNHEPYAFLDEHGPGEIAENCWYLGRCGSLTQEGLSIAGLSGIHLPRLFSRPRPEPRDALKNPKRHIAFHSADISALQSLGRCDILMTHDWPSGIVEEHQREEISALRRNLSWDRVGNKPTRKLMEKLKPRLALCGHMHKAWRSQVPLPSENYDVQVCCLADIASGSSSFAVFEADTMTDITVSGAQALTDET